MDRADPITTEAVGERSFDVIVVGGGLAGLAAAHQLGNHGIACTILEARSRLGGRVFTALVPPDEATPVELGARCIAPFHTALCSLLRKAGVEIVEVSQEPDASGRLLPERLFVDDALWTGWRRDALEGELESFLDVIQARAQALGATGPLGAEHGEMDAIDVRAWAVGEGLSPEAAEFINDLPHGSMSALALVALASADDRFFEDLESLHCPGGLGDAVTRLAASLEGARICLEQRVRHIEESAGHVRLQVEGPQGTWFAVAHAAIVAVPATCLDGLGIDAAGHGLLVPGYIGDRYLSLLYDGEAPEAPRTALSSSGIRSVMVSDRSVSGGPSRYSLEVHIADGSAAIGLEPKEAACVAWRMLGHPEPAATPRSFDAGWRGDPLSLGTYASFAPGQLTGPVGARASRIGFAGDWRLPRFAGFMEGAVRSGIMAADHARSVLTHGRACHPTCHSTDGDSNGHPAN